MDVSPDVWGQLALEASQVYLTDGTAAKSPFAGTVSLNRNYCFVGFVFLTFTTNLNNLFSKVFKCELCLLK